MLYEEQLRKEHLGALFVTDVGDIDESEVFIYHVICGVCHPGFCATDHGDVLGVAQECIKPFRIYVSSFCVGSIHVLVFEFEGGLREVSCSLRMGLQMFRVLIVPSRFVAGLPLLSTVSTRDIVYRVRFADCLYLTLAHFRYNGPRLSLVSPMFKVSGGDFLEVKANLFDSIQCFDWKVDVAFVASVLYSGRILQFRQRPRTINIERLGDPNSFGPPLAFRVLHTMEALLVVLCQRDLLISIRLYQHRASQLLSCSISLVAIDRTAVPSRGHRHKLDMSGELRFQTICPPCECTISKPIKRASITKSLKQLLASVPAAAKGSKSRTVKRGRVVMKYPSALKPASKPSVSSGLLVYFLHAFNAIVLSSSGHASLLFTLFGRQRSGSEVDTSDDGLGSVSEVSSLGSFDCNGAGEESGPDAAGNSSDEAFARQTALGTEWGPFTITPVYETRKVSGVKMKLHKGWGALCGRHQDATDGLAVRCKTNRSGTCDETRRLVQWWCLLGWPGFQQTWCDRQLAGFLCCC